MPMYRIGPGGTRITSICAAYRVYRHAPIKMRLYTMRPRVRRNRNRRLKLTKSGNIGVTFVLIGAGPRRQVQLLTLQMPTADAALVPQWNRPQHDRFAAECKL